VVHHEPPEAQALLPSGTTFHGRYQIVRLIKVGGMGIVYEVLDRETQRHRALKTMGRGLTADADMRARFHLEVTAAARIKSDHIVDVFDAGTDEGTGLPFLVMELLQGESLAALIARRRRVDAEQTVQLLRQAALALDRAHAAGIVHRDLKPENLFVTHRDDGSSQLKLLDFGIAKVVVDGTQPQTTRSLGTPLYMSPEQVRGDGDIGPRADLYSLAHVAFAMLVGAAYWEADSRGAGTYALLLRVAQGSSEAASARASGMGSVLPAAFDDWFRRAAARDASERFDSASELVEELAEALGVALPLPRAAPFPSSAGTSVTDSTAAVSRGGLATPPPRRRTIVLIAAVSSLGILTAFGVVARRAWSTVPAEPQQTIASSTATPGSEPVVASSTLPASASSTVHEAVGPPTPVAPVRSLHASPSVRSRAAASTRPTAAASAPKPVYDPTDIR
jgi:serine/threonine-protein kinase